MAGEKKKYKEPDGVPLEVSLIISNKNDKPCLEIRKQTTDIELIKTILSCAFHEVPIITQPKFRDKLKSVSTLIKKGVIYKDGDDYFFTV